MCNDLPKLFRVNWILPILLLVALSCASIAGWTLSALHQSTVKNSVASISTSNLAIARALSNIAQTAGARDYDGLVKDFNPPIAGTSICLIDASGRLLLHSLRPDLEGKHVAEVATAPGQTVSDLITEGTDWVGLNTSYEGKPQVAAYVYNPVLGGLVVVHTPVAAIEEALQLTLSPVNYGFFIIAVVMLVALGVLWWLWRMASRRFEAHYRQALQLGTELVQTQKLQTVAKLATGVAHDFNNILTIIRGNADLLAEQISDSSTREFLAEIDVSVEKASLLANRLLALGRNQPTVPEALDCNHVVADFVAGWKSLVGPGIRLRTHIHDASTPVYVDRLQLQQVLLNLVINARDAMSGNGVIDLSVTLCEKLPSSARPANSLRSDESWVRLTVSDNGPGMSAEILPRLFSAFNKSGEVHSSTGIGLAVVMAIVQRSGGTLQVKTDTGQGTHFDIYLPLFKARSPFEPNRIASNQPNLPRTALLVDKDLLVRQLLKRDLSAQGWTCLEADRVRSALRTIAQNPHIDCLISEWNLADGCGLEVADALRAQSSAVQILYVVGSGKVTDPDATVIKKPFSLDQINTALHATDAVRLSL